ncbi:hypothetical protein QN363_09435 [Undibacterium sp. CCC2.1]|nr:MULTISPECIES: hypothetical protein [unclassified Undibacterium]MEB0139246.1 hypothetical protein [Undibacterium sp. CCC2.1]MEB0172090.1 hypothetical protein [Undibacterium sp. CCC1.1]MEB0175965.1 hypothetical protein [Undibacterium sp. CCC3.4]MEB0215277.1 hypothetical protein [Undibacterium sp. 5I2]
MHQIRYDGFGVIQNVHGKLSQADYTLLRNHIVTPLSATPIKHEAGKIRTAGEALIDIAAALEKSSELSPETKSQVGLALKNDFLSRDFSAESLTTLRDAIASQYADQAKDILASIDRMIASIDKEFHVTRHNDNYYGRLFETELSSHLVLHPNADMLAAGKMIADYVSKDFQAHSKSAQSEICQYVVDIMKKDCPAWRTDMLEANQFIASSTPKNFMAMLACEDAYSLPLLLALAVKYTNCAPSLSGMLAEASKLYVNVITRQRLLVRVNNSAEQSQRHGVMLHYQKQAASAELHLGQGERPIDRYQLPVTNLTGHNQAALHSETPVAVGMSGSSNILKHLFKKIATASPAFPTEQAQLMTAAYLTFSGGHTFNEAYTVFNYESNRYFAPLSYQKLQENPGATAAVDHAYQQLLLHAQGLNEAKS